MTPILSETRERFLVAIAKEIDTRTIAEIHFFQPIRQGGVESGIAVVATERAGAPSAESRELTDEPTNDSQQTTNGPRAERFTVHSARYRLVQKGAERGKWEASVVEEADAPLITVETVVRGVQRRSGDLNDPDRLDGETIRALLSALESRRQS